MESIKIYLCQLNFHVGNLKNNLDKILSAREEVRKKGGDLCIFSELSITGYPPEDLVLRKSFIESAQKVVDKLVKISEDDGPSIIIGYPRLNNNKLINSAELIYDGKI